MLKFLIIGMGGFFGALARYGVSGLVHRFSGAGFPAGTLAVNVLGCLVIGVLMCLVEERQFFSSQARLFVMIGFLGSFTTMSTFGYETFEFLRSGEYRLAALNMGLNLLLCVAAVMLGWAGVKAAGI